METIPCRDWDNFDGISQGIFSTSSSRGWGIFLFSSSNSIQEIILFLYSEFGSLVCHIISGKRF